MAKIADEPNMSDSTLLVTVEDLINQAMGPPGGNVVDFKLIQVVLQILARQQRMLQQKVEIQVSEFIEVTPIKKSKGKSSEESTESSSSRSPRPLAKPHMAKIKEEQKMDDDKRTEQEEQREDDQEKVDKKSKQEQSAKEKAKSKKDGDTTEKELGKTKSQSEFEKVQKEEEDKSKPQKESGKGQKGTAKGKSQKDMGKTQKKQGKKPDDSAATSLTVTDSHGRTNIDVVTQSQFAILEAAIKDLMDVAAPQPLSMPKNEKLRKDLAKGTATLPDAMEAMQVVARMKAAEAAIQRMSGLITHLAGASDLADVGDVSDVTDEREEKLPEETIKSRVSVAPRKSVMIDPKVSQVSHISTKPSVASYVDTGPSSASSVAAPRPSQVSVKPSVLSKASSVTMGPSVTQEEMESALRGLHDEISKSLNAAVSRAATAAETALHTAVNVANKLDVALKLDGRISALYAIVGDYSDQLSGFDAGLTTQMQGFKDQIAQMRSDLKKGLQQLDNVNNNAETAAVMELTERYTELVVDLDTTMTAHTALQQLQSKLAGEMHEETNKHQQNFQVWVVFVVCRPPLSLVECVEMLREQKCDRDEVLDGLRDKADISRLAGLLSEVQFATARTDFERRLDLCHDKFNRQDAMWTSAVMDLSRLTDQKAELIELLSLRDTTQKQLQELQDRLHTMAVVLGEPKAALLTRQLARGAVCGACGASALMEPRDSHAGAPPRLPPLRAEPEPEPCNRWIVAEPPLERHVCHRWAGGSHTLLSATTHERAPSLDLSEIRTMKYTGHGTDGRLYMLEEDLKPCVECNMLTTDVPPEGAQASDTH
ncbi:Glutamine-rich protein 2 [Danaus plexippus plexippus]|uniref:Glutamine-rich protein 2 n=1 Tax=Danaus plexippus plexippus TaxID=278856 RepID=A0A212FKI9_DANPL|nr:Glutamine-rich protein 2 [Danaus plexippus plexippus]